MTAKDFKKKPVQVQAIQFTNNLSAKEIVDWIEGSKFGRQRHNSVQVLSTRNNEDNKMYVRALVINTLEGAMRADLNDWVIMGVNGEFYPCKPAIFEQTYEEV